MKYLLQLANTGLKVAAAEGTGHTYDAFLKYRRRDDEFEADCLAAMEVFKESLENAAVTRARDGIDEPVYQGGVQVGTKRKYSDKLLELLLKRHRPEFRDRAILDHNVTGGVLLVGNPQQTIEDWEKKHGGDDESP